MGDPPAAALLTWFPLATEQLRLRALSEVVLFHPRPGDDHESETFYLSLHTTALSSPFCTLAPARQQEDRVVWGGGLARPEDGMGGARSLVVRVWAAGEEGSAPTCLAVWGVGLSGLICIGDKLAKQATNLLAPNSLVFRLHQYYFVCNASLGQQRLGQGRRLAVPGITEESGKPSYDRPALAKLHATLRALRHSTQANCLVKAELAARGLDSSGAEVAAAAPSLGARSISSKILEVRVKQSGTRRREVALARRLEDTKFRTDSLRRERVRLGLEVAARRAELERAGRGLGDATGRLAQGRLQLERDREALDTWLRSFQRSRESNRRTAESVRVRRLQLISQLSEIFPIQDAASGQPTICYVALPGSDSLHQRDDTDLAVGLGWTAHLTLMVSSLLGAPLRYPTLSAGSRSCVEDLILDRIPDKDRQFPLFPKGNERVRFDYGVFLLNKNIAQLRWYCGEGTADAKLTLRNLAGLLALCCPGPEGSQPPASPEYRLPAAPPVLAGPAPSVQSSGTEAELLLAGAVQDAEVVEVVKEAEVVSSCDTTTEEEATEARAESPESEEEPAPVIPSPVLTRPPEEMAEVEEVEVEEVEEVEAVDVTRRGGGEVEEAVEAADLFRDIALRTEALAASSSFKSSRQRYYK